MRDLLLALSSLLKRTAHRRVFWRLLLGCYRLLLSLIEVVFEAGLELLLVLSKSLLLGKLLLDVFGPATSLDHLVFYLLLHLSLLLSLDVFLDGHLHPLGQLRLSLLLGSARLPRLVTAASFLRTQFAT